MADPVLGLVCATANSEGQTASNAMTRSEILIFINVRIFSRPISIRKSGHTLMPVTNFDQRVQSWG